MTNDEFEEEALGWGVFLVYGYAVEALGWLYLYGEYAEATKDELWIGRMVKGFEGLLKAGGGNGRGI